MRSWIAVTIGPPLIRFIYCVSVVNLNALSLHVFNRSGYTFFVHSGNGKPWLLSISRVSYRSEGGTQLVTFYLRQNWNVFRIIATLAKSSTHLSPVLCTLTNNRINLDFLHWMRKYLCLDLASPLIWYTLHRIWGIWLLLDKESADGIRITYTEIADYLAYNLHSRLGPV